MEEPEEAEEIEIIIIIILLLLFCLRRSRTRRRRRKIRRIERPELVVSHCGNSTNYLIGAVAVAVVVVVVVVEAPSRSLHGVGCASVLKLYYIIWMEIHRRPQHRQGPSAPCRAARINILKYR